jgi:hypothetical protein
MNAFKAMLDRHSRELHAFPMFFAFSGEQFRKGMERLGLEPCDTGHIYSFGGSGGFYRRDDAPRLHEMLDRHHSELRAAIEGDLIGDGFICDMFRCELAKHEFNYMRGLEDTLEALCMTREEIEGSKPLRKGLAKAIKILSKEYFFR